MAGSRLLKSYYHTTEICLGFRTYRLLKQLTTLESQMEKQMEHITKVWLYVLKRTETQVPVDSKECSFPIMATLSEFISNKLLKPEP